jgi:hypothetical protein
MNNFKFLHELVDYLHSDSTESVRQYVTEQVVKTTDNNKGYFWEGVLAKAMSGHTTWLGKQTVGRDYDDNTDAKFATFYRTGECNLTFQA